MNKSKEMAELRNALKLFVRANGKGMTDTDALSVSSLHEKWKAGRVFTADDIDKVVRHGDGLYRIASAHTAQAHYPPDGEGLLALYRPISPQHTGTHEDPIPWVYGMDCFMGLYYTHNDALWICAGDMTPCVWAPGTAGVWQWEHAS